MRRAKKGNNYPNSKYLPFSKSTVSSGYYSLSWQNANIGAPENATIIIFFLAYCKPNSYKDKRLYKFIYQSTYLFNEECIIKYISN